MSARGWVQSRKGVCAGGGGEGVGEKRGKEGENGKEGGRETEERREKKGAMCVRGGVGERRRKDDALIFF